MDDADERRRSTSREALVQTHREPTRRNHGESQTSWHRSSPASRSRANATRVRTNSPMGRTGARMMPASSRPAASQAVCSGGSVVTSCEKNARRPAVETRSYSSSEACMRRRAGVVVSSRPRRRSENLGAAPAGEAATDGVHAAAAAEIRLGEHPYRSAAPHHDGDAAADTCAAPDVGCGATAHTREPSRRTEPRARTRFASSSTSPRDRQRSAHAGASTRKPSDAAASAIRRS